MSRTLIDRKRSELANLGWQAGTGGAHPIADLYRSTADPTTGTGAITLQAPGVSGTGTETATATGAVAFAAPAVTGSGTEALSGTGAVALAAPVVAGSATETISGSGAVILSAPSISGTEEETLTASGGVTFAAPAISGTGTSLATITGSGAFNDCGSDGAFDPDAFDSDAFDSGSSESCLHISISGTGTHTAPSVTPTPPTSHPHGPRLGAARVTGPAGRRRKQIRGKGGIVIAAPRISGIGNHNDDELALAVLLGAF